MTISNIYIPDLPVKVKGLAELALDIRWSWSHSTDVLWKRLDPELWDRTRNPWLVLQTVSESTLRRLSDDLKFCEMLDVLVETQRDYLRSPTWFESSQDQSQINCVAYFSMEFGVSETLPIYSGGLGLLAGDHMKSASDLGVPVVGVGLLYQEGYFRQALDADGSQIALYPSNNPGELPITPVRDSEGERLRLKISIDSYQLWIRAWQAQVGRTMLYLLDLNDPANRAADRCITGQLYGGGSEQRLQQEILLGIGGWRLLNKLGIEPEVCHLNEGHAALAVLERARCFMQQSGRNFSEALAATRAGNIFTTHTPVPAGFDLFQPDMVRFMLGGYSKTLEISVNELLALGRSNPSDSNEPFNMVYLAIRGSAAVNGVSRLHGYVSRKLFAPLFPGWPIAEVPIDHVTNGVHVPSWDSEVADKLWTDVCGKERWVCDPDHLQKDIRKLSDENLWMFCCRGRENLINYVRWHVGRERPLSNYRRDYTDGAQQVFDPNILTLGFARRFATYKRPNLLLHDPGRLVRLLTHQQFPVQLIIAGKAHPEDWEGQALIQAWIRFMRRPDVQHHVIFLTDYDMRVAEQMVQGVDVWINTPRRPWEASGTSGMKVLVNGGLNLSVLDGWWAEAYSPEVGWALGNDQEHPDDDPLWDIKDADELYTILENEVVPTFYTRDEAGIPTRWVALMRESMARLTPHYSTNRMVREYTENYYFPAADEYRLRAADNAKLGTQVEKWRTLLEKNWMELHFGEVCYQNNGATHSFQVPVYLGEITPGAVDVELYAEGLNGEGPERIQMTRLHPLTGAANGFMYSAEVPASRSVTDYTPRIVPHQTGVRTPLEANQILWEH